MGIEGLRCDLPFPQADPEPAEVLMETEAGLSFPTWADQMSFPLLTPSQTEAPALWPSINPPCLLLSMEP